MCEKKLRAAVLSVNNIQYLTYYDSSILSSVTSSSCRLKVDCVFWPLLMNGNFRCWETLRHSLKNKTGPIWFEVHYSVMLDMNLSDDDITQPHPAPQTNPVPLRRKPKLLCTPMTSESIQPSLPVVRQQWSHTSTCSLTGLHVRTNDTIHNKHVFNPFSTSTQPC